MTYGIMPQTDYETMDKILSMVINQTQPDTIITTLEIGVHEGKTSRGIRDFIKARGRDLWHTCIDNQRDFKMDAPFYESRFIIGNSEEVHGQVRDDSQEFILVDGNHNLRHTILDFVLYNSKLKIGGIMAFHDCGSHIGLVDYQGEGDRNDPDNWIACRKALSFLGLIDNKFPGFELILDIADPSHPTGGIIAIRKTAKSLYESYMTLP